MNLCKERFFRKNAINLNDYLDKIFYVRDINYIFELYGIQGNTKEKNVCVDDIMGFLNDEVVNVRKLSEALDYFFDFNGDTYHTRSIEMLDYNESNVIEGLNLSFKQEPIGTLEVDQGKHVILTNGKHRFLVLRMLYLNAKQKCKSKQEIDSLNEQFQIPVIATEMDIIKSYCKYLINLFQPAQIMNEYFSENVLEINKGDSEKVYEIEEFIDWSNTLKHYLSEEKYLAYCNSVNSLRNEYDNEYKKTGRSELSYFNGKKLYLNDDELIEYTKKIMLSCEKLNDIIEMKLSNYDFRYVYEHIKSFREFIDLHFSDILNSTETKECYYKR